MPINLNTVRSNIESIKTQGGTDADVAAHLSEIGVPPKAIAGNKPYYYSETEIEPPTRLESIGRGMADVYQGAQQLVRGDDYDAEVAHEMALYDKGQGEGFDAWRVGGQAAPFVALSVLGGPAVATWLAGHGVPAWAMAAGAGGLEAGTLATEKPSDRVTNAALGAIGGTAGYGLAKGLGKVGHAMMDAYRSLKGSLSASARESAEVIARATADRVGEPFDSLAPRVQRALMRDAQKLMDAGLDPGDAPEALARHRRLTEAGLTPTSGRVTRNPTQWSDEDNLMKVTGVGDDLQKVREANMSTLHQRMQGYADEAGEAATPEGVGRDLSDAVKGKREMLRGVENKVYQKAADTAGRGTQLPAGKMADDAVSVMEAHGDTLESAMPRFTRDWLEYVDGKKTLTVGEAEKFIKRLNRVYKNIPKGEAGRQSRAALDAVRHNVLGALDDVGGQGSQAAKAARKARRVSAATRKAGEVPNMKQTPLVSHILDDAVDPAKMTDKILGARTEDVAALVKYVTKGPAETRKAGHAAMGKVRRQIMEKLWDKASAGARTDGGFSGKRLQDEIQKIGVEKLRVLFPSIADDLTKFAQTALDETYAPALNKINRSNSGTFLADMMSKAMHVVPIAGDAITGAARYGREAVQQAGQRSAVRGSINNALARSPAQQKAAREAFDQAMTRLAPGLATSGIALPSYLNERRKRADK